MAERTRLKINTIGAEDFPKSKRVALRKAKAKNREAARRLAKGATPRALYESKSHSQTKPWQTLGMSRAKWYRAGRPMPVKQGAAPCRSNRERVRQVRAQ
jgi:hypothetical protein